MSIDNKPETTVWEGRPSQIVNIVFYVLLFWTVIFPIVRYLKTRTTHYRLTTQRLHSKTGILTQVVEQTELYRVRDYRVTKPLIQRLFGLGSLDIVSSDTTQPSFRFSAIKDPEGVADLLRGHVEASRLRTKTREVDFS